MSFNDRAREIETTEIAAENSCGPRLIIALSSVSPWHLRTVIDRANFSTKPIRVQLDCNKFDRNWVQ